MPDFRQPFLDTNIVAAVSNRDLLTVGHNYEPSKGARMFAMKVGEARCKAKDEGKCFGRYGGNIYPYAENWTLVYYAVPLLGRRMLDCRSTRQAFDRKSGRWHDKIYFCDKPNVCPYCRYRKSVVYQRAAFTNCFDGGWFIELTLGAEEPIDESQVGEMGLKASSVDLMETCFTVIDSLTSRPSRQKKHAPFDGALIFSEIAVKSLHPIKVMPHIHVIAKLRHGFTPENARSLCMGRLKTLISDPAFKPYVWLNPQNVSKRRAMSIIGYGVKPIDLASLYKDEAQSSDVNLSALNSNVRFVVEFMDEFFGGGVSKKRPTRLGNFNCGTKGSRVIQRGALNKEDLRKVKGELIHFSQNPTAKASDGITEEIADEIG